MAVAILANPDTVIAIVTEIQIETEIEIATDGTVTAIATGIEIATTGTAIPFPARPTATAIENGAELRVV